MSGAGNWHLSGPPIVIKAVRRHLDRTMEIPPSAIVRTGYVALHKVRLANQARMAVGDVKEAFEKRLALGSSQPWPPPRGFWCPEEAGVFVIEDGRHEYVASLMLGFDQLLVAWVVQP